MVENKPFESLKYKEFKCFITARFIVTIAFSIQFLVVEWFVYQLTKNPVDLGLIALAEIIPAIGFSLISGHFIDKSEKRNATLFSILASILVAIGFYFILKNVSKFESNTILVLIYSLVFCFGIIRAFFSPSVFSLFSLILPKEVYANGTTWSSSAWQIGAVLGPAIAGFLVAFLGSADSILVTLILLVICLILIFMISKKEIIYKATDSITESLTLGLRFVFGNKLILTALSLDLFAVLFGGAIALLPIFIADELIPYNTYSDFFIAIFNVFGYKIDQINLTLIPESFKIFFTSINVELQKNQIKSFAFGVLRSAPAIGAITTMIIIAYLPIKRKTGIKLLIAIFIFGLCIIGFGFSKYFWISFFILILSGISDGVSVVIRSTILQLLTPDDMRGRVAAVNTIFVGSSNELGAFESGITAKLFGTVNAVIVGGIITCCVVTSTYFISPKIKDYELE